MKKQTTQFPELDVGSWRWSAVEDAIEEFIYNRYNVRASLDGDHRNGSERIQDGDLRVRKVANIDTVTNYFEGAVTFILGVRFDPLEGDRLEFKELSVNLPRARL